MAVSIDQQPSFKFFCRICKKGFGCGRALGGHMRAHGIGDESGHMDDDDQPSDWEDKMGGGTPPATNKRMYALRTNPNRLKSCRVCENCGKEFSSWKSFLEHGKCTSEEADAESLVSSPGSDEEEEGRRGCGGWSKGKRSRRVIKVGSLLPNCPSSEEEDLAHCLVMLSTARVEPPVAETEESCASASKEEERQREVMGEGSRAASAEKAKGVPRGLFECKACKKVFNSHQALGGHRASHKKVKGCFAAKLDDLDESLVDEDVITHDEFLIGSKTRAIVPFDHHLNNGDNPSSLMPSKRKSKVHECSICHRIFASGQALGGHKRCHWVTSNSPDTSMVKLQQLREHAQQVQQRPVFKKSEPLDLNLPAPVDDAPVIQRDHEGTPLQLETTLYLQQWIGLHSTGNNINNNNNNNINNVNNHNNNNNENNTTTIINNSNISLNPMIQVDDEADSKIKLAKLSDLKDINMGGGSSPWLQVGIGSTANGGSDP
ncbi:zinc finger protein ZAT9-like [Aristolochia californica]|uniref:zinc finger protein ZAT9-like n=1 Tax=Aristolochia californica TaxID=171875 RepID=UPI0035D9BEB7